MQTLKSAFMRVALFCDHWDWVWLGLAAPFLLFPSPTRSLALLIVPGVWIARWLAHKQPLPRTPFNLTLLLVAAMVLVSLYATYDINVSLPKIAGMVLGFGTFYAFVRHGRQPGGWWLCFWLWLVLGVGYAGLALVGAHWGTKISVVAPLVALLPSRLIDLGVEGGFSANELAGALVWLTPALIALSALLIRRMRELRSAFGRWRAIALVLLTAGMALFMTGVLILTQSRGGYLGFAIAMVAMVFMALPKRGQWLMGGLTVLAILLGVVSLWSDGNTIIQDLDTNSSTLRSASTIDTWDGRVEVWSRGLDGIQDFPFTGMGMNTFRHIVSVLYPFFLIDPDMDISHAHNEFLQAALDLGLAGLIGFLALYMSAFWMLWNIWRQAATFQLAANDFSSWLLIRTLVLGLGAGLIAHIVYGLTDVVALGAKPGILFWMMLGLIAGLFEQAESEGFIQWRNWMQASVPFRRNRDAKSMGLTHS
jgi:putative inorganic carbon (HCO3(-)) transporter